MPPPSPPSKGGVPAWLIGLIAVGLLAFVLMAVGSILLLRGDSSSGVADDLAADDEIERPEPDDQGADDQGDQGGQLDPEVGVSFGDHWHADYGFHGCGEALPGQVDGPGSLGQIHTHADQQGGPDNLIHIHPHSDSFAKGAATLGVFMDAIGADLTDDRLEMADGTLFDEAVGCDGEAAVLRIARWENALAVDGPPTEVFDRRLARTVFQNDGEAYTIFFGPEAAEIPPPPSSLAERFDIDPQPPTTQGA